MIIMSLSKPISAVIDLTGDEKVEMSLPPQSPASPSYSANKRSVSSRSPSPAFSTSSGFIPGSPRYEPSSPDYTTQAPEFTPQSPQSRSMEADSGAPTRSTPLQLVREVSYVRADVYAELLNSIPLDDPDLDAEVEEVRQCEQRLFAVMNAAALAIGNLERRLASRRAEVKRLRATGRIIRHF